MATCYSFDGQVFSDGGVEEALDEFESEVFQHGLFTVYVGDAAEVKPSSLAIDPSIIEEQLAEECFYVLPEKIADRWSVFESKEDRLAFERDYLALIDKHASSPGFAVKNIKEIVFNWSVLTGRVVRVN